MPRQGVSRPAYPLKEVKRLAMKSQVLFRRRKDGKATPANVGLTEAEACAVIARLRPWEFDITSQPPDEERPADVYKTTLGPDTLYIKLLISETGELLVVISFHL